MELTLTGALSYIRASRKGEAGSAVEKPTVMGAQHAAVPSHDSSTHGESDRYDGGNWIYEESLERKLI